MAESNVIEKRRRSFVSWPIQGRLLSRMAVYWCVYHVFLWHAMFMYRVAHYRGELMAGASPRSFADLYGEFAATHYSLIVCALATLPILIWDGIRTTHRIAGPIVAFRRILSQLKTGRIPKQCRLRKRDMLVELQDAFNEYLDALRDREESGEESRRRLDDTLERIDEEIRSEDSDVEPVAVGGEVEAAV